MKRYKIIIGVLGLCLFATSLNAGMPTDSLTYYLLEAEANNPQLKAQFYQAAAKKEQVAQAGVLQDPELAVGVFVQPMETWMGDQLAEISLMQMFPWFGTLKAMREEASHMSRMEQEAYAGMRQEIRFQVKKAYYSLYALNEEITQTVRAIEWMKAVEQTAITRYANGSIGGVTDRNVRQESSGTFVQATRPAGAMSGMQMGGGQPTSSVSSLSVMPMSGMSGMSGERMAMGSGNTLSDVLRIQIERAELESRLLTLQDRMVTEQYAFNILLNREGRLPVSLPESLDLPGVETDEEVLAGLIKANNPMLKMYEAEKSANAAELRMARKMSWPMIGLGVQYMPMKSSSNAMVMGDMNGKSMFMPMVSLTLPLYRNKYKAEQREIGFKRRQIESNAEHMENGLLTEAKEAVRLYRDAARRITLYRQQQQLTERSLTLLLSLYATSESSIDEVLRAEKQLVDFKIKTAIALSDAYMAEAQLEKLTTK